MPMITNTGLLRLLKVTLCSCAVSILCQGSAGAQQFSKQDAIDKESAKNANVSEAQKLNGEVPNDKEREHLGGASALSDAKDKHDAKETAAVVNQVPGVKVKSKDLEPPTQPAIKGFHPIKKLLRPVENLEGMTIKLEQQIMKLEGPIAALQPPMLGLQKKMTGVEGQIGGMQGRLNSMQGEVTGVRSDLATMRKDIESLKEPIQGLRGPIGTVAKPLEAVERQLNFILLAILVASIAVAVGTPIAAILVYRYRHKLFPDLKEHELPKVEPGRPNGHVGASSQSRTYN